MRAAEEARNAKSSLSPMVFMNGGGAAAASSSASGGTSEIVVVKKTGCVALIGWTVLVLFVLGMIGKCSDEKDKDAKSALTKPINSPTK